MNGHPIEPFTLPLNVTLEGTTAYVTTYEGLYLFDVAVAANPVQLARYQQLGEPYAVVVDGGLAYIADRANGLRILDVTSPTVPRQVGAYQTVGMVWSLTTHGDYLYIASWKGGLDVVDVSTPALPGFVGSYGEPRTIYSVVVSETRAYLAESDRLSVLDVTQPAQPTRLGDYPARTAHYGTAVVSGDYAYLTIGERDNDGVGGFLVFDVSQPTAPEIVGAYAASARPDDLVVAGGRAYLSTNDVIEGIYPRNENALHLVDVRDPRAPRELTTIRRQDGDYYGHFDIVDDYLYSHATGFRIFDRDDPYAPLGYYGGAGRREIQEMVVVDAYAYVATPNGLHIVDVSNPSTPRRVANYATVSIATAVAVQGDIIYLATMSDGVQILRFPAWNVHFPLVSSP